jgi:hypothetical protein
VRATGCSTLRCTGVGYGSLRRGAERYGAPWLGVRTSAGIDGWLGVESVGATHLGPEI